MKSLFHKHNWQFVTRGLGEAPKQNTPEPILFDGHLAKCKDCPVKMFFPDDPNLPPQEVSRAGD